jgi:hypothetical protein
MTRIIGIFGARTLLIAPTGKEMQTLSTNNYISRFFLCLQHQYIGARWLVAFNHLTNAFNVTVPAHSYTSEHHLKIWRIWKYVYYKLAPQ